MRVVEAMIARQCIEDLLAAGFYITVNDGEEDTVKGSRDLDTIFAAMATTDDDRLCVSNRLSRPAQDGWVRFVYGNEGWDVINDYTTNLEPALTKTMALVDKLSSGGPEAVIALYLERDTAHKELASLRLSVRRIAEVLDHNIKGLEPLPIPADTDERGWNRLCAAITERIDTITAIRL